MIKKYYTAYIDDCINNENKNIKYICEILAYNLSIRNFILRTTRLQNNRKNYFEIGCDKDNGQKEIYITESKYIDNKENTIYIDYIYQSLNEEIKNIFDQFIIKNNVDLEVTKDIFSLIFSLIGNVSKNDVIKFSKFFIFYTENKERKNILQTISENLQIPYINVYEQKSNQWIISDLLNNLK